jgi:hypothetical protein
LKPPFDAARAVTEVEPKAEAVVGAKDDEDDDDAAAAAALGAGASQIVHFSVAVAGLLNPHNPHVQLDPEPEPAAVGGFNPAAPQSNPPFAAGAAAAELELEGEAMPLASKAVRLKSKVGKALTGFDLTSSRCLESATPSALYEVVNVNVGSELSAIFRTRVLGSTLEVGFAEVEVSSSIRSSSLLVVSGTDDNRLRRLEEVEGADGRLEKVEERVGGGGALGSVSVSMPFVSGDEGPELVSG